MTLTSFNKLWGGIVGLAAALLGMWGLEEHVAFLQDDATKETLTYLLILAGVVVAPKNKEPDK